MARSADLRVRPAARDDAAAVGRLHVRAWQAAYRGQMPDAYLDSLSVEERAAIWSRRLAEPSEGATLLVIERGGIVIGFAAMGPARESAGSGELYAINVDPAAWGTGAGRALLAATEAELARLGHRDAVLWVLPGNARARHLYERAGWTADGAERTADVLGVRVPEVRYGRRLRET